MDPMNSFLSMIDKGKGGYQENVVIKVKYGDSLRRFSAYVDRQFMIIEYDMNKLKAKISNLFNFSSDAIQILTYTDEDGDVIALDNDEEFRDAVLSQRLNPLRITVQLSPYLTDGSKSIPNDVRTSDNNSDIISDVTSASHGRFPGLADELNSTVEKSLKPIPDPIRGVLTNLSRDVIRTASTAPVLSELLLLLSKMQLTNFPQSSQEPIGKPMNTSSGSPSRVTEFNTNDGPKVSNDPQNQLPEVLPQANFVSSIPDNLQKVHEIDNSSQCLGSINRAPVNFDQKMSKEQMDNFEVHRDGKSVLASEPSIPFNIQGGNSTVGTSDKSKPFAAPMSLHGNTSTDRRPSSMFPFGSTSQGDAIGNWHASTAMPYSNMRPDATSRCPFNMSFSQANGYFSHKDDVLKKSSPVLTPFCSFHRGVICDGCGMHPIVGPRYKSTVKENYDLCSTCFRNMGTEAEYTRIDLSPSLFFKQKKDHHKHKHRNRILSKIVSHSRLNAPRPKLWSCFVRDVTVWDGTVMLPFSRFTKMWRMRNNGEIAWPSGTQLVWVGGNRFTREDSSDLEIPEGGFPVDEELDIALDCAAPSVPGKYASYWQLMSPSGQNFGEEVWVIIQVDDQPSAAASCASPASLNLNLPPEINHQNDEIVYTEYLDGFPVESETEKFLEEMLKPLNTEASNPPQQNGVSSSDNIVSSFIDSPVSLIEAPIPTAPVSNSTVDIQESLPQVMNPMDPFMLNGAAVPSQPSSDIPASSFIGSAAPSVEVPKSSSLVSYPTIDIPNPLPPVSYPLIDIHDLPNPSDTKPLPLDVIAERDAVEQTLLRELEEMGFKQFDLNKEILRHNRYDLEQSVEDLCAFEEWDPLLKELHEMGFNDRELNKKLLSKNSGSIKRVVMELITGEKGD